MTAHEAMAKESTVERVAHLLWQVNEGYLTAEDRAIGTNWFAEPVENLHPDDQAERPHWIALAEEVIAEVRGRNNGSPRASFEMVCLEDDHDNEATCYLALGHDGDHEWTAHHGSPGERS
jgi:hypothetical protein